MREYGSEEGLHELLLAWEESPPDEAATRRLVNRLSAHLPQPERAREMRRRDWTFAGGVALFGLVLVTAWLSLPMKTVVALGAGTFLIASVALVGLLPILARVPDRCGRGG